MSEKNKLEETRDKIIEKIPRWFIVIIIVAGVIVSGILIYKNLKEGIMEIKSDVDHLSNPDSTSNELSQSSSKKNEAKDSHVRKKTKSNSADKDSKEEQPPDNKDCYSEKPQTCILNDMCAKLVCCRRTGGQLLLTIQISKSVEGKFLVCANHQSWVTNIITNKNKKHVASSVVSDGQARNRCIEINYIRQLDYVEFDVLFDQVDTQVNEIARVTIATSYGNLIFTKIPIL